MKPRLKYNLDTKAWELVEPEALLARIAQQAQAAHDANLLLQSTNLYWHQDFRCSPSYPFWRGWL